MALQVLGQTALDFYGAATAVVAATLILFQPTEFGIKVAILSSLMEESRGHSGTAEAHGLHPTRWLGGAALRPASIAVVIIALTALAGTASLPMTRTCSTSSVA